MGEAGAGYHRHRAMHLGDLCHSWPRAWRADIRPLPRGQDVVRPALSVRLAPAAVGAYCSRETKAARDGGTLPPLLSPHSTRLHARY